MITLNTFELESPCIIRIKPDTGLRIYLKTRKRKVITVLQLKQKQTDGYLVLNEEGEQVTFEFTVLYVYSRVETSNTF